VRKKILLLILFGVLLLPILAQAVTLGDMAKAAAKTALEVATGVVVVMWVVTGVLFLSALGAPERLKSARTGLLAAVIGTVIIIVANGAVGLVGGAFGLSSGSGSSNSQNSQGSQGSSSTCSAGQCANGMGSCTTSADCQ